MWCNHTESEREREQAKRRALTFGVEGNEAVAERPVLHGLVSKDRLLGEDHHADVVEQAQALQDLRHGLGVGLLCHGADAHHDLPLRGLQVKKEHVRTNTQLEYTESLSDDWR